MLSLIPHIIPRNLYKKSHDAVRTSITMTTARCLYMPYVHDSTMLLDRFDALTTSHHVLSVCAISYNEIDHDATRDAISVRYATPQPWQVLIL
jgi:hypothetical protein